MMVMWKYLGATKLALFGVDVDQASFVAPEILSLGDEAVALDPKAPGRGDTFGGGVVDADAGAGGDGLVGQRVARLQPQGVALRDREMV